MTAKKSKKDGEIEEYKPRVGAGMHELILDKRTGKYEVIDKMSFWAKQLRKLEEHRHLTQTEILDLAILEVLSEKVSSAELEKLMAGESAKAKKKESSEKPDKE